MKQPISLCLLDYLGHDFPRQKEKELSFRRFLNFLTRNGKKFQAEILFVETLKLLLKKVRETRNLSDLRNLCDSFVGNRRSSSFSSDGEIAQALTCVLQGIENVRPFFEVKKVRVAGSTYQVPAILSSSRSEQKAMNWLRDAAFERKKKNPSNSFEKCLAEELFDAFQKQGNARQKRNELHKTVEANRAFAHFRWW